MSERTCTRCGRILPATSEFFYADRGGLAARCKPCFIKKQKQWALTRREAGIYAIVHVATGRIYVGSAVDLRHRCNQHLSLLRNGRHHAARLQRAWNRDGDSAFRFEVLEVLDREDLLVPVEQAWINFLGAYAPKGGYNSLSTAGRVLGLKHTPEVKQAQSVRNRARAKPYVVTWPDGREEETNHLPDFCRANGLKGSSMAKVGRGGQRKYRGFSCRLKSISRDAWEKNVQAAEAAVIARRQPHSRQFPTRQFALTFPDGTVEVFTNVSHMAIRLGVNGRTFHAFVHGRYKKSRILRGYSVSESLSPPLQ